MRALLLAVSSLLVTALPAPAGTVDQDLVPGGRISSTIFPVGEAETFRVSAPAGSVLTVDLRPAKKGPFAPALLATLSDGSAAVIPPLGKSGRTKARLPFPQDGVLEILVVAGRGVAGDYVLKTKLKIPGAVPFAGDVAGPEGDTFEYFAPAGSLATVAVKAVEGTELIPKILSLEGPGGPVEAGKRVAALTFDKWMAVPQPAGGPWTLTVGSSILTTGPFSGSIRWKAPKGPSEDHRIPGDPSILDGSYSVLLAAADAASGGLPSLLTGVVGFDGAGRAETALSTRAITPDAGAPLGFSLGAAPVAGTTGSCFVSEGTAAVGLDLGPGISLAANMTVAAGGSVLYTGVGVGGAPITGLMLERVPVPAQADLAGSWLFVNATTDGEGASSVEVGTLAFGSGGTVSGIGVRTSITVVDGTPTPGGESTVLRTGSFSVGEDGTITVVTVPNIVGAPEAWTSRTAFGADILTGLDDTGGGGRLFLRQGTGLTAADIDGNYVHFGMLFAAAPVLRSGILGFDGEGGYSGNETSTDLTGVSPPASGPVTGAYTVDAQGFATLTPAGGATGNGIVGPEGRYLFTVSFGEAGVGVDLLISLE